MAQLYLRSGELIIKPKIGIQKKFANLRINFNIEKTSESYSNKAAIKIYNLSKDSRTFVEQKDAKMILQVGYSPFLEQVYIGDIRKSKSERQGPDWVTTLEGGDGEEALENTTVDKSYKPNTSFKAIIVDLLQSLGLPIGSQDPTVGATDIALNGFSVSGKTKDAIDDLAAKYDFEWSVQDGNVILVKKAAATFDQAVLLTSTTGLIQNVQKREDGGIEFRALIQPALRPGRLVSIKSDDVTGFFKCRKVTIEGDTHEGGWECHCEAEKLGT